MIPFIAYDVSRLLTRYAVATPNGIDRIDLAYARHFLATSNFASAAVFLCGPKPLLLDRAEVMPLLDEIAARWQSGRNTAARPYKYVQDRLLGLEGCQTAAKPEASREAIRDRYHPLRHLILKGLLNTFSRIPMEAIFIHTTHYPSWYQFRWLGFRQDIKAVFFIHDLLPLQFPEYFRKSHIQEHRRAVEIFARYSRSAIVNTHVVEHDLRNFLHTTNRRDVPILVEPIPAGDQFTASINTGPEVSRTPYFVVCGTIEPRKNHILLFQVWRELSRQWGEQTPKLIVVGRRGWENENVLDLLDRSHELKKYVIEVADLPTRDMVRLFAGARALLMPSFAEGYGLPIVEARTLGTPVIASDIPVFREVAPDSTFCHPLDGLGWLDALKDHARRNRRSTLHFPRSSAVDYFARVEEFLLAL